MDLWQEKMLSMRSQKIIFCHGSGVALLMTMSVCRYTALVHTEIFQQIYDGLPWIALQIFMVPRKCILNNLVITWFSATKRFTFMFFCEMSTTVKWTAVKFGSDVHVPLKKNSNRFGDPLTFNLVPSSGRNFNLFNYLVQNSVLSQLANACLPIVNMVNTVSLC